MQKSNFQLLAEELNQEIQDLDREIKIRRTLLEKAPGPSLSVEAIPAWTGTPDILPTNSGFIAGTYGMNADTVVRNPNVLAATKGKITPDADPRVKRYKPAYSNNLATMMGLGIDDASFNRAKEFIKQYGDPNQVDRFEDTDDPEQSSSLSWKKLNNAVSRYQSQKVKDALSRNHLFRGPNGSNYEQALPDTYQRFVLGKKAQKAVEDVVGAISGKEPKARGKQVKSFLNRIKGTQSQRMNDRWSQPADQAGKFKK
jgi:hypothetical protein